MKVVLYALSVAAVAATTYPRIEKFSIYGAFYSDQYRETAPVLEHICSIDPECAPYARALYYVLDNCEISKYKFANVAFVHTGGYGGTNSNGNGGKKQRTRQRVRGGRRRALAERALSEKNDKKDLEFFYTKEAKEFDNMQCECYDEDSEDYKRRLTEYKVIDTAQFLDETEFYFEFNATTYQLINPDHDHNLEKCIEEFDPDAYAVSIRESGRGALYTNVMDTVDFDFISPVMREKAMECHDDNDCPYGEYCIDICDKKYWYHDCYKYCF